MQVRKSIFRLLAAPTLLFGLILFGATSNSFATSTDFVNNDNNATSARIIASFYMDHGQNKLITGLHLKIKDGWKVYAPDDSGFGQPPYFDFQKSDNIDIKKFNILWPTPIKAEEEMGAQKISYAIYKNEVIIPIQLQVINANKDANLEISVNYGLCKDVCIPVSQKFSLKVPESEPDQEVLKNIQQYLENKSFFNNDTKANTTLTDNKPIQPINISLIQAILIALIGGMLLNVMPCVLPVLSIKLLTVVSHRNTKIGRLRCAFLYTALGIVCSFIFFAFCAIGLQSLGKSVGWGLQFQNPYFLIFLIAVLMIFIANLLAMFEFNSNTFLNTLINKKIDETEQKKNIFIPNFLSGILAVLLSTPCSAPFVGTAVSFALTRGQKEIFIIFTAMGIGLAMPYLFLILFPKASYLLPKPGNWMIKAKQIMAGLLAATVIWLINILSSNIGFVAGTAAAILAVLILFFFKINPKIKKFSIKALILAIIIALLFIVPNQLSYLNKMHNQEEQKNWISFDQKKLQELVSSGKTVVVDITADWCITCKVNKTVVLNSAEVMEKLHQPNVVAMRGDLTTPDDKINQFMREHNRYGIPFDIVFGPGAPNGILASEFLNKTALVEAIDLASKPQN